MLHSGLWEESRYLYKDPHLADLAQVLPDILLASKAPSTTDKYRLAWQRWKRWAARFPEVSSFPVKPFEFALYLRDLMDTANSIAPIEAAVYGVRWAHKLAALPSPTEHDFVKATVEGCKRLLAKPVNPKDPIPVSVFASLVAFHGGPEADLADLRFLVLCLVSFAGFMRISELLKVKLKDIKLFETHMSITVSKRKNDQFRKGHIINLNRTGNVTCPVVMTERLIAKAKAPSDGHLICRVVRTKAGLKSSPLGISYTRTLEIVKEGLKPFVGDDFKLGTHSLKSGAATTVVNKDVDHHAIDKHAGWRSEKSKFRYADDSLTRKLAVSSALGL